MADCKVPVDEVGPQGRQRSERPWITYDARSLSLSLSRVE